MLMVKLVHNQKTRVQIAYASNPETNYSGKSVYNLKIHYSSFTMWMILREMKIKS